MSLTLKGSGTEPLISNGDILRCGLLKKMKSYRKKWFVLRAETPDTLARLEYYDSEKKFRSDVPPKRSIALKTCFNINRRQDTKHKHVIALYTKDDCLCIIMDNEEDLEAWLNDMLKLQREIPTGELPKPKYEHVWQVYVCESGLGDERSGLYRLCLTDRTLSFIPLASTNLPMEYELSNIRSCGHWQNFFRLEIGRSGMLGEGILWMEATDRNVCFYIHKTVYQRMTSYKDANKDANKTKDDMQPTARIRSSSATEASKPTGFKKYIFSPAPKHHLIPQDNTHSNSETSVNHPVVPSSTSSTSTGGGATRSGTICHQRTQSLPSSASPSAMAPDNGNIGNVANHQSLTTTNNTTTTTTTISNHPHSRNVSVTKRPSQSTKCFRDRCDSMPSRQRTSSEGNHPVPTWNRPYLVPRRPHIRDVSHSPPTGSPISPPSDSTGSSYSLPDDNECPEMDPQRMFAMPTTPDEAILAIAEEDITDSPSDYMQMGPPSVDDGFQDMPPRYNIPHHSNSASMSSVTSGTPSTDIRFSDYPLDKVASYFTEDDNTRPARAWSVGSKPPGVLAEDENSTRIRAFSVGSKSNKIASRVLPPHYAYPGIKSSSAPMLPTQRGHSYSSIGPMSDLMEMDFTQPRSRTSTNESKNSSSHDKPSCNHRNSSCVSNKRSILASFLDMKRNEPTKTNEVSPYVDMSQGKKTEGYVDMTRGSAMSGYMDMSGGATSPLQTPLMHPLQNVVDTARYFGRNTTRDDYVDMDANNKRNTRVNNNKSHAVRMASSPSYQWPTPPPSNSDYLDMSGSSSSRRSDRHSFSSQLSCSPNLNSISPKSDYMSMGFGHHHFSIPEGVTTTAEGYVEMTPGLVNRHQRQSSLDGASESTNDDYLDMSGGSKTKPVVNTNKNKSVPVSIQATTSNQPSTKTSSPITISSLLGRKNSTGTPPRMHLPLTSWATTSPYASLPRQKARKNSSSKESSTSNSVTTTPSSSSIMFPMSLNSPSSPASKTGTPTTKIPPAILNIPYKKSNEVKKNNMDDYAMMDFEPCAKVAPKVGTMKDTSEYVNYCPGESKPAQQIKDDNFSDYAVMKPRMADTGRSMTLPLRKGGVTKPTSSLATYLSNVELNDGQPKSFKPISEVEMRLRSFSPKAGDQVPVGLAKGDKHQEAASTQMDIEESPYETLRPAGSNFSSQSDNNIDSDNTTKSPRSHASDTPSRPSSVCSDISRLGSTSSVCSGSSGSTLVGNSRPESVNSDRVTSAALSNSAERVVQLHYASLDLAQSDEDNSLNRSPRTMKGASSGEVNVNEQPTFVYADIDFVRSEEFKNNSNVPSMSSNTRVK